MHKIALAASLVASVAAVTGCATIERTRPERPVAYTVDTPVPTLIYLCTETRTYGSDDSPYQRDMAIIELRNDTPFTFVYVGQDADWPAGSMYEWVEGAWVPRRSAACGNGWETQSIAPGQSIELVVHNQVGHCRYEMRMRNVTLGSDVTITSSAFDAPDLLGDAWLVL